MSKRHPFQVYLDDRDFEALKFLAKQRNVPMAYIIRESVARYLSEAPVDDDPAAEIIGLGHSEKDDVATRHDEYLTSYFKDNK